MVVWLLLPSAGLELLGKSLLTREDQPQEKLPSLIGLRLVRFQGSLGWQQELRDNDPALPSPRASPDIRPEF